MDDGAQGCRALPLIEGLPPHHQDPLDRILVAQARVEPMHLLTHDPLIAKYGESIVLV